MRSNEPAPTRGMRYVGLAALLAGLSMVSPFSIDTFFPAFRAMEQEFGVAAWQMQQSLTAYMLPYAFTAVFYGPLSDAVGRRKVILAGLTAYTLGSLACVVAPNFVSLLAFRALQGATAGVGMVVGRAIVRDLYQGPQAQRLMSLISLLFGVAPAIAPVLGGWIHVALGWRAVFAFLALFGLVLVVASALKLPETHPPERRVPFSVGALVAAALRVIGDRQFLLLALAASLTFAGVFCYIGAAPVIVLDHWGLTETQFIWLFLPVIGGFTLGAILSGRLAGRIAPMRQAGIGFALAAVACSVRLLLHWQLETLPVLVQQALLFFTGIATQLIFPVLTLRMLDLFPQARGSAASMQTFVSLIIASATIGIVVPLVQTSLTQIALLSTFYIWLALALWRLAGRLAKRSAAADELTWG
ncbi:MAG TPA: multidrug effflux MFS transporter [Steroidobacteraceae bacterium]|nr:multidrug effflux MFS transporter [Steroidobacteraceae bacterium]